MTPDEQRLLALARLQATTIGDPAVRQCWDVVIHAIEQRWLLPEGRLSVQRLIEGLEAGGGASVEEYAVMVDDEDPDKVVASFVTDEYRCPRDAMIGELRRLEDQRRTVQDLGDALARGEFPDYVPGLTDEERTAMASAVRTFADWAEHPERTSGAAVDAAIRLLEQTVGAMQQGRRLEQQRTRERMAQSARDAIARRLANLNDNPPSER